MYRERERALAREREANERLLAARKEGFDIPPLPEAIVEVEPLIPELQALVDDWEGEGAKAMERKIRSMMADGKTQAEIARLLRVE